MGNRLPGVKDHIGIAFVCDKSFSLEPVASVCSGLDPGYQIAVVDRAEIGRPLAPYSPSTSMRWWSGLRPVNEVLKADGKADAKREEERTQRKRQGELKSMSDLSEHC